MLLNCWHFKNSSCYTIAQKSILLHCSKSVAARGCTAPLPVWTILSEHGRRRITCRLPQVYEVLIHCITSESVLPDTVGSISNCSIWTTPLQQTEHRLTLMSESTFTTQFTAREKQGTYLQQLSSPAATHLLWLRVVFRVSTHYELHYAWEKSSSSYLVDSIRPVLSLQTEGAVLPVLSPALSRYGAVQVVGSVELDSWLAGGNLQDTPTGRVTHSEMKTEGSFIQDKVVCCCVRLCVCVLFWPGSVSLSPGVSRWRQTEVVVKAWTWNFLQARPNRNRLPEVKGRGLHWFALSCGYMLYNTFGSFRGNLHRGIKCSQKHS